MLEPKREGELATATTTTIQCQECPELWWDVAERWRALVDHEQLVRLVFYCPDCAEREFS